MQFGRELDSGQHLAAPPTAAIGKPEVNPDLMLLIGRRPEGIDFPAIFRNEPAGSAARRWNPDRLSQFLARPGCGGLTVCPVEPAIVQARAMSGKR
jgi:hypothetical protein